MVLLLLGGYVLSRLTWGWWLPSREVQPMPGRPQVGCAVLRLGHPFGPQQGRVTHAKPTCANVHG